MKQRFLITLVFILSVTLVCLTGCQQKSSEDVIRERIEALVVAAEQEQVRDFLAYFSETVQVQKQLTKRDVGALALRYFLTHKIIKMYVNFLKIDVDDNDVSGRQPALANINARVLLTSGPQALPQRIGLYEVSGYWQKVDGEWLIQKIDWRRLTKHKT